MKRKREEEDLEDFEEDVEENLEEDIEKAQSFFKKLFFSIFKFVGWVLNELYDFISFDEPLCI
jgi:hypothetical protein